MKLRSTVAALAVAGLLVLAVNPAGVSAAAKNLVLGTSNTESKTTTLTNTGKGPALSLTSKPGKPALKVSSSAKVAKLNADQVDGMDASALGTRSVVYTMDVVDPVKAVKYDLPLESGHWLVGYSAYLNGAQDGDVDCYLGQQVEGIWTFAGETRIAAGTMTPGLSGSASVEKTDTGTVAVFCSATNPFTTYDNEPFQVVATRITDYTDGGALASAPRPAGRAGHR